MKLIASGVTCSAATTRSPSFSRSSSSTRITIRPAASSATSSGTGAMAMANCRWRGRLGARGADAARGLGARDGAGQHALDVARDQINLKVDRAVGDEGPERRVLQRVRDQVDAEFAAVRQVFDAVDGQADAV